MLNKKNPVILAIETSCDETSAAVLEGEGNLRSSVVSSQVEIHAEYGGVVPEIAARQHTENINIIIEEALIEAGIGFGDLSAVAVTVGPGLIIALLIGMSTAKAVSYALDVPLIGVNHIEGHIYAGFFEKPDLEFPFLSLVISGGHTSLIVVNGHGGYKTVGSTLDDAAGEAFDKVAKFLGLEYPGGPVIDKLASKGDPGYYKLPRPMIEHKGYDFSFSGLKTAVINLIRKERSDGFEIRLEDLAASFQQAVIDVLVDKTFKALKTFSLERLVVAGGVASNKALRERFSNECAKQDIELVIPRQEFCTDNAAMIAKSAYYKFMKNEFLPYDAEVKSVLSL